MTSRSNPTFRLKLDGKVVMRGLNRRELDAVIKTARKFKTDPKTDSGVRIDTERE
jgi:hypothetical protein